MVRGYAIVLVRRNGDARLRRCGVRIDVAAEALHEYVSHDDAHASVVREAVPATYDIQWFSEWRRGRYSRDEPLRGWDAPAAHPTQKQQN